MLRVTAQITSTREQEYFVHQRSRAIKRDHAIRSLKGSPRALKRKARKHPESIISAKARNSTPSEDNTKITNLHLPPPRRSTQEKQENTDYKEFKLLRPTSSMRESITQENTTEKPEKSHRAKRYRK
jgi:hypothetical protein